MSKKNSLTAFFVIGIFGTLLHFAYEFLGQNPIVGLFSAVNESIWEHNKLLFYPSLIYFGAEYLIMQKRPKNYIPASIIGIVTGIIFIMTVFYTYSGIIGYSVDFINILLFFIGVIITIVTRNIIIKNECLTSKTANRFSVIVAVILIILFSVWTFYPPKIPLFIPPA